MPVRASLMLTPVERPASSSAGGAGRVGGALVREHYDRRPLREAAARQLGRIGRLLDLPQAAVARRSRKRSGSPPSIAGSHRDTAPDRRRAPRAAPGRRRHPARVGPDLELDGLYPVSDRAAPGLGHDDVRRAIADHRAASDVGREPAQQTEGGKADGPGECVERRELDRRLGGRVTGKSREPCVDRLQVRDRDADHTRGQDLLESRRARRRPSRRGSSGAERIRPRP